MELLYGILIGLEVLVSLVMIIAILLQPSDQGLGMAFGGAGTQTLFGGRGATHFLSKLTGVLAAIFFVLSVAISLITGPSKSVVDTVAKPAAQHQPVTSGAASGKAQKQQKDGKKAK